MKNYWLENRYTEPFIYQPMLWKEFQYKWVVTKQSKSQLETYPAGLPSDDYALQQIADASYLPDTFYLHKDGTWVRNTTFKDGEYSGYFDSKEEAESCLISQS
jgi:hypothetical protein